MKPKKTTTKNEKKTKQNNGKWDGNKAVPVDPKKVQWAAKY